MSGIKKAVLCNLFIATSFGFWLSCEDKNLQDHQDLILICDSCPEEIYPLEDTDTICLMSDIKNYLEDLETDQSVATSANSQINDDNNTKQQFTDTSLNSTMMLEVEVVDPSTVPSEPEDIMILDHEHQESSDLVTCQLDEDQKVICDMANLEEFIEHVVQDAVDTMYEEIESNLMNELLQLQNLEVVITEQPLDQNENVDMQQNNIMIIEQLEDNDNDIIEFLIPTQIGMEQQEQFLHELVALNNMEYSDDCNYTTTIPVDDTEIIIAAHDGIKFEQDVPHIDNSINTSDDIVPVPHDLINSVKKAEKQKKKLAKKEKSSFFKKSKNKLKVQ